VVLKENLMVRRSPFDGCGKPVRGVRKSLLGKKGGEDERYSILLRKKKPF